MLGSGCCRRISAAVQGPHSAAGGVLLDVWALLGHQEEDLGEPLCCALRCAAAIARIATTSLAHTSNVATLPPPDYFSLTSDPSYLPCSPCQPQPWRSATPASTWCPPTACSWASLAAASASTRPGPAPAPSAAWVRLWGAAGSRGVAQPSHSPTPSLGVREERLLAVAVKAPPPPPPPPASAALTAHSPPSPCSARGTGPHLPLAGHLARCAKPRLWRLRQAG